MPRAVLNLETQLISSPRKGSGVLRQVWSLANPMRALCLN